MKIARLPRVVVLCKLRAMIRFAGLFLFAALFSQGAAWAEEVTYQREVTFPSALVGPVLVNVYAPVNPADTAAPDAHWIIDSNSRTEYFQFSSTEATDSSAPLSRLLKLDKNSRAAMTGFGTAVPKMYFFNYAGEVVTFNPTTHVIESEQFADSVTDSFSLAVSSGGHATLIGTDLNGTHGGYSVNTETGATTRLFSTDGDGSFSSTTFYQSYGADGLLYVLDYGNNRMQVLDPDNAFAAVREFTLQGTVANMQFAMSFGGSIFLGDGAGGGSMYSSTGTLLDTFALPAGSYTNPFPALSNSYVDYTPDGHVFVFDTTGAHQYAVVPEPATWGFLSGIALLSLALMRRRSRSCGGHLTLAL
jgi:hypothetical protein